MIVENLDQNDRVLPYLRFASWTSICASLSLKAYGRPLNDESRFHIAANVATVNALVADVRRAGGSWKLWTLLSPTAYFFSEARLTDSHTGRPRRCSGSGRRSRAVRWSRRGRRRAI